MKKTTTLAIFYSCVGLFCIAILAVAFLIRSRMPEPDLSSIVIDAGKESTDEWFKIEKDLEAVNQEGEAVKLSDLKGKVWLVAEFFAICPHCAVRNGEELHKIFDEFKDNPDFHIVCISVDPENDDVSKLKDYSTALNADSSKWWFLNAGDIDETHQYLEKELKFFGVRERKNPADIEANGRFLHDLGFLLVDRDFRVVGKWPLADARSEEARQRDPGLYDRLKKDLFERIETELNQVAQ